MSSPDEAASIVVGRYAVHDQIGSGGMATVHLGRLLGDGGFTRTVAIKRLKPHVLAEADAVAAFKDEARLAARIRHPNVVQTIDVVDAEGELFLVMEYVEGLSIAELVKRSGSSEPESGVRVPPSVVVAIVSGALHGLHAAHEAQGDSGEPIHLVHRDVSPQNILVGVDGVARVLDFGVAKAMGRLQTTRDGRIKGKLAYMAPEQLSGRGVTRKTDVFAAGVVLWELLTGRPLFRADEEAETVTRVLFEPIPPPSQVAPESPAALDAVVLRALDRNPTRRFATAEDMSVALEAALAPAGPRAVGEWVRGVAREALADRAERIRLVEQSPTGGPPVLAAVTVADHALDARGPVRVSARRSRMGLSLGLAAFVLGGGAIVLARSTPKNVPPAAPAVSVSVTSVAASPPASALPQEPAPVVAASAAAPSVVPSARTTGPHLHGHATTPPRAPPTTSARPKLYSRD